MAIDINFIQLVEQFVANASITISFPQTGGNFDFPSDDGGLMSTFSTYGPTNDVFFKPARYEDEECVSIIPRYPANNGCEEVKRGNE